MIGRPPWRSANSQYQGEAIDFPYVNQFRSLFNKYRAEISGDKVDETIRESALTELQRRGFPLGNDEEWIHTPVKSALEEEYTIRTSSRVPKMLDGFPESLISSEPLLLLTVNGERYSSPNGEYSQIEAIKGGLVAPIINLPGVEVGTEWNRKPALLNRVEKQNKASFSVPIDSAFTSVSRLFGSDVKLHLTSSAADVPYHIMHMSEGGVLSTPRVQVAIAPGARVTIVESFVSLRSSDRDLSPALTCGETEIYLGVDSSLTYVRVQATKQTDFEFNSTKIVQEHGSHLNAVSLAMGSQISRHNLNVLALGKNSTSHLGGITIANSSKSELPQVIDNHTFLEHAAADCTSKQLYKMVLGDGGHGIFSGRILVRPTAQRTNAFQLNNNLLLNDGKVDTSPILEIGADDVRCTHGATIGRLDDDQLFYLQARGVPKVAAMKILARGFLDEVIGSLSSQELYSRLKKLLHQRLELIPWSWGTEK